LAMLIEWNFDFWLIHPCIYVSLFSYRSATFLTINKLGSDLCILSKILFSLSLKILLDSCRR
jgi:hypothetical protein